MKSLRRGCIVVVLIAGYLVLTPIAALSSLQALHLSSFEAITGELTSEIYGSGPLFTPFPYFYSTDKSMTVSVPGDYLGQLLTLSSTAQQEAAWIMDKYAHSNNGEHLTLGKAGTEVAVQIAIWTVTNQVPAYDENYASLFIADNAFINDALENPSQWALIAASYRYLDLYAQDGYTAVQDLIVQVVPIPSAVWLLGSALLCLLGFRRRYLG